MRLDGDATLRRAGLKVTSPRLRIFAMFSADGATHLSVDQIYKAFLAAGLDIGQSTIYRTLSQLESARLIRKSSFSHGKNFYALDNGEHHDHLICLQCGRVVEVSDEFIEQQKSAVAARLGYVLAENTLSMYCHCKTINCAFAHRDARQRR